MSYTTTLPFFSIVVPTYNRADLIGKAIRSILDQNIDSFEIIIIDDASKDNTEEVVRSFVDARIKYFKNATNLERSASRNKGVKFAAGEYVTFLDSDDFYYPEHLSSSFEFLKSNTADVYYQRFAIVDENDKVVGESMRIGDNPLIQLLKQGTIFHINGLFVKRAILLRFPFMEDMNQSEDYEFFIRLLLSHKIYYSNKITSALLSHSGRGVLNINQSELERNMFLLFDYVKRNEQFSSGYMRYFSYIESGAYSYISLHLVLAKRIRPGIRYLIKAIVANPISIVRRRTLAIIKHTLLAFFK